MIHLNGRHAKSGEMRRLHYGHPNFVRLQTNAATNADFLNYIGQQTRKNTFARIIEHLNPFVNANNFNFTFEISDKTMLCGWSYFKVMAAHAMPVLLRTRAPVYCFLGKVFLVDLS